MGILENWFTSPNTWDELKKQNKEMLAEMQKYEHKIKLLESDVEVARHDTDAKIKIAISKKEAEHQIEIAQLKSKYEEKYYNKLNEALMKGTPHDQFNKDLLLKFLDKAPVQLPKLG